jgi:cyclic beta-1,2-glucan synthetase
MLRLGLIENVRRMALRTVQRLDELEAADRAAARIARAGEAGGAALDTELDRFASNLPQLTPTFVSRFLQLLRVEGGDLPVVVRLEKWIADEALSAEEATARTTERLALTQVGMANSITSLRAIARMEWKSFVEDQSRTEAILREDPAGFYTRMTFATRDLYRHTVERIARRTRWAEEAVARSAIDCARAGSEAQTDARRAHVGYYLIDHGLAELEQTTGYRGPLGETIERWARRHPNVTFVGGVGRRHAGGARLLLWIVAPAGLAEALAVLLLGSLLANDIAVNVVNQLVTAFCRRACCPSSICTSTACRPRCARPWWCPPCSATWPRCTTRLENLEVQFLANRAEHLHFAVLSDFTDSPTETREETPRSCRRGRGRARAQRPLRRRDAGRVLSLPPPATLQPAGRRLDGLGTQARQARRVQSIRPRRRRGCVLRSYRRSDADPERRVRHHARRDTTLPPGAAPLLVGALAHPLNRAVFDPELGRVVRGYGILQPRVGISLPSAHRSVFASLHSGHPGVDPYTTAVSDVYQDLYGEGSFTGKGVYEVQAFVRATQGRFPRTRCCLTISSRAATRARASRPTSSSTTTIRAGISRSRGASTAGSAATGSSCRGSRRACRGRTAWKPIGCRSCRAGRSSTTSGAARSRSRSSPSW